MHTFTKLVFAQLLLFPFLCRAQHTIEPYIGYNVDVNNKGAFSQFNIGLQYPMINKPTYQMLIGARVGLPLNRQAGVSAAYTFDQTLPLRTDVDYTTQWHAYSILFENRFRVASWANHKNNISLIINIGFTHQRISAKHGSYNRDKYTILNPQRTATTTGAFVGSGIQYKRATPAGHFFLQLNFASPPIAKRLDSYYYNSPASLGLYMGYIINFKKRK